MSEKDLVICFGDIQRGRPMGGLNEFTFYDHDDTRRINMSIFHIISKRALQEIQRQHGKRGEVAAGPL